jgi:hypothetical protein
MVKYLEKTQTVENFFCGLAVKVALANLEGQLLVVEFYWKWNVPARDGYLSSSSIGAGHMREGFSSLIL